MTDDRRACTVCILAHIDAVLGPHIALRKQRVCFLEAETTLVKRMSIRVAKAFGRP